MVVEQAMVINVLEKLDQKILGGVGAQQDGVQGDAVGGEEQWGGVDHLQSDKEGHGGIQESPGGRKI